MLDRLNHVAIAVPVISERPRTSKQDDTGRDHF